MMMVGTQCNIEMVCHRIEIYVILLTIAPHQI